MKFPRRFPLVSATVSALALLLLLSFTAEAKPSNKWRLPFSGGAESDGVITLKLTPEGGEPIVAEIAITKGTGENDVAKAVVEGLKAKLPKETFHVERDDGEDVLIKKKYRAADFDVEIVSNTVEGIRISSRHE